ncbi:hypothetical protein KDH_25480 [Dictyobacter sp. S3.2.2.5]|uniref:Methylated-DNA-[protein]-cysteine S-methyltransferase DNA binding domain-containing protein n=1 Tax=Dictyobacter halimunensis TaxID=3026934 RepID=A0ABQ6FN71_9CHLR|nr:hypothetical protein KDH_25480 [Dictyobacter sp. S3.2.2.5]
MELQEDLIVDIPEDRVRFFGGTGKMLLPCPATIEAQIMKIPEHSLLTTNLLCKMLTAQFNVQGTCPITTKSSLRAVAQGTQNNVAYWRVVTKNGGLMSGFPGGVEEQAANLRKEGFTVDTSGKTPRVQNFTAHLVHFD